MKRNVQYKFKLYVAGNTVNSASALANLTKLCHTYLPDRYVIDVVDVLREPGQALAEGIFMTPTLVKLAPGSPLKIVGTLSRSTEVLQALGLDAVAP